ncbi:hypothetical protein GN956_G24462 [Arapaima gigas]
MATSAQSFLPGSCRRKSFAFTLNGKSYACVPKTAKLARPRGCSRPYGRENVEKLLLSTEADAAGRVKRWQPVGRTAAPVGPADGVESDHFNITTFPSMTCVFAVKFSHKGHTASPHVIETRDCGVLRNTAPSSVLRLLLKVE